MSTSCLKWLRWECAGRVPRAAVLCVLVAGLATSLGATELDDYVGASDPSYAYSLVSKSSGSGYTTHILRMVSQTWRSEAEVDRTAWVHWVTVVIPSQVEGMTAFLWITGGNHTASAPTEAPGIVRQLAVQTGTVAASVHVVPNQPLVFADDGKRRVEDEIISYTFDRYLASGDGTWPALLPMVKSVVRAMNTVQAYVPTATAGRSASVERFVVSGASKRGWTTWLTAAVDSRVLAIAPMVIDVLNIDEQMAHHRFAYEGVTEYIVGGYSSAVHDYVDMNIMQRLGTPEGQNLLEIVDPYEYRSRLELPKYLIHSTGDQFFVPDSAQFYFHELPGVKYLRYIPNTDHGLGGSPDAILGLEVFYQGILDEARLPRFSWSVENDGAIRVKAVDPPSEVALWQAVNPVHRDFRLETLGAVWSRSPLSSEGDGVYVARPPLPEVGYRAFFVELRFPGGGSAPYIFTTQVSVLPAAGSQLPGDCNQDAALDVSDAVCLLLGLFGAAGFAFPCGDGSAVDPANISLGDLNGDGGLDISDAVYLLSFLFMGSDPPALGGDCVPVRGCPDVCRR